MILNLRTLSSRVLARLRQHPMLAVPVMVAEVVSFSAIHLQHALHQPLFNLLLRDPRSVLTPGDRSFSNPAIASREAALLVAPMLWGCYFLSLWLYIIALVTISELLGGGDDAATILTLRQAFHQARYRKGPILRTSGWLFGLILIGATGVLLLTELSLKAGLVERFGGRNTGYAEAALMEILAAFVATPLVLKLLREPETPSPAQKHLAILCGAIAVVAQFAILLLIDFVTRAVPLQPNTALGFLVLELIEALLGASVFVPLFVELSLIARGEEREAEPQSAESDAI